MPTTSPPTPTRVVWYKPNDLRIHDHGPLCAAHLDATASIGTTKDNRQQQQQQQQQHQVLHVLVLDPLLGYGPTAPLSRNAKLPRIGGIRATFLVEAIHDLDQQLRNNASKNGHNHALLLYVGVSTVSVFRHLEEKHCGSTTISAVYTHGPEFCSEEQSIERGMKELFGDRLKMTWGWTLHHPDDLVNKGRNSTRTGKSTGYCAPERYKDFLNQVCSKKHKRSTCFRIPGPDEPVEWAEAADCEGLAILSSGSGSELKAITSTDVSKLCVKDIIRPEALNYQPPIPSSPMVPPSASSDDGNSLKEDAESIIPMIGGETAALAAMNDYIWKDDRLRHYVGSSDSMTPGKHNALNSTTGLSAYLAFGCLSPRTLYAQVLKYEKERTRNRSTYWVFHELVFRDFFVFCCIKWSTTIFRLNGPNDGTSSHVWRKDGVHARKLFDLWKTGQTGYPMVDAGMRQLVQTGQMPHLVRQMVAGFLVRDLRLDWRWGAEWFEQCLLDYTTDANYGNWAYRILPLEQLMPLASKHLTSLEMVSWPVVHDPHLEYTLKWVPELREVLKQHPDKKVYVREPWRLDANHGTLEEVNVKPCKDSPLWIMSVNRSSWPEYQQMMSGKAWTLQWKSKRIGNLVDEVNCPYAYPIVAPLELEIMHDKIPLDHSWGGDGNGNGKGNANSNANRNRSRNTNKNTNRNDSGGGRTINGNRSGNSGAGSTSSKGGTGHETPTNQGPAPKARKRPGNRGRNQKGQNKGQQEP